MNARQLDALEREETELTLGTTSLLLMFFGLVLVCGLCFGLGYVVGRRGAEPTASGMQQGAGGDGASAAGPRTKPSATSEPGAAPVADQGAAGLPASAPPETNPANTDSTPAARPQSTSAAAPQPAVRPTLPPQAPAPQPARSASLTTEPVTPGSTALMVQIAAVSHPEDADVLVGALRKRGYAVTARRDLADSLIHVQIGPFTSRSDANEIRQKLLNDGYNAIIQQ